MHSRTVVILFNLCRFAALSVGQSSMKLSLAGKMFAVFDAELEASASYGSLESAQFSVAVKIEDGLTDVSRLVVKPFEKYYLDTLRTSKNFDF